MVDVKWFIIVIIVVKNVKGSIKNITIALFVTIQEIYIEIYRKIKERIKQLESVNVYPAIMI